jgi:hypothetical protein
VSPKQHLGGRRLHSNEEVQVAVNEWLEMQEHNLYSDGIFKLVPGWDKCNNVLGIVLKNNYAFSL